MMGKRSLNPRRVKIHRNYTVGEISFLFKVHKNTVREWIKQGLPVIDDQRPKLIHGSDLSAYLKTKRVKNKRPCKPGEMYCFRCRKPKTPALNIAECEFKTENLGNLFGICPDCDTGMNQAINLTRLVQIKEKLDITLKVGE